MTIEINKIQALLSSYNEVDVEKYTSYIRKLLADDKNKWINYKSNEDIANFFKRVDANGLKFDGIHVTLQNTGITLDFVAYKNKMLLAYPETKVDLGIVYKGDDFSYSKENGKVQYNHTPLNPFDKKEDNILGAYCVIKNSRGEFITTLSKEEIDKHRKVAKTDYIWKAWLSEMINKTVIKKACKFHYDDVFTGLDEIDNEAINLNLPVDGDLKLKSRLEKLKSMAEVNALYKELQPSGSDLKLFTNRISELQDANS
jgi:hypothetical protein